MYRPFGPNMETEEQKARGRVAEINNGRLAMLGLFGFLSEATVPGSVPALAGVVMLRSYHPMFPSYHPGSVPALAGVVMLRSYHPYVP